MNPYPLVALNHLTVPVVVIMRLILPAMDWCVRRANRRSTYQEGSQPTRGGGASERLVLSRPNTDPQTVRIARILT